MKLILSSLVAIGLALSPAASFAEGAQSEAATPEEKTVAGPEQDTTNDLSFLKFATVVQPGELTEPGDIIKISRDFTNWTLRCDIRRSTNRRACFVEQRQAANSANLVWRIAMNQQNRPIAMISAPGDADINKGIRMRFAGLEKVLDRELFRCGPQACIGGFYFEGFVQQAISNSKQVGYSFSRKDGDDVNIDMSMTGFNAALDAGARDPYGRDVTPKTTGLAKEAPAKTKKVPARTSSKATSPVSKNQKPQAGNSERSAAADKPSGLF